MVIDEGRDIETICMRYLEKLFITVDWPKKTEKTL